MKNNCALIVEKISFTLVEIKTKKNTIPYTMVSVERDTSAQNVEKINRTVPRT